MYLIANSSGKQMIIGDLGLVLKPKQAIDLHKVKLKTIPERSGDLSLCVKKGLVKVLKQDSKKSKKIIENVSNVTNVNTMDQKKLLESIRSIIKEEVKSQSPQIIQGQDNKDVMAAIQELMKTVKTQKGTVVIRDGKVTESEEDLGLDHDTLVKIHSKTVDKRMTDTEGKMEYEDQEIIDIGMGDDLSELEDLL